MNIQDVSLEESVKMRIRGLMEKNGITQGEMAEFLGVSQATLSRTLSVKPHAHVLTLRQLANMCNVLGLQISIQIGEG